MRTMNQPLRLLQFSDTHLFGDIAGQIKGVNSYASLQQVLASARARHGDADALLLTGDIVHDDAAGYEHINTLFGKLGKPVYCLPGNHDDTGQLERALHGTPFQVGGHVDLQNWRIVMLDSVVPGAAHGELSPRELARLDSALASAGKRHILICLHHHPVQMASQWLDEFFALVDRCPQVRAICWGHVHQQFDVRRKGVRLLAVPSTCAQFTPYSEQFAIDQSPPGYRHLSLHQDGRIDTDVVRVELDASALRATG